MLKIGEQRKRKPATRPKVGEACFRAAWAKHHGKQKYPDFTAADVALRAPRRGKKEADELTLAAPEKESDEPTPIHERHGKANA